MKIKVLHNYGGHNTHEKRILPGIYDSEDLAIFGLAAYLVENGHAVVVEDTTPITEFNDTRPTDDNEFHNEVMKRKGRPTLLQAVTDEPFGPLPEITEGVVTEEHIAQPVDREAILAALDEAGIQYSKFWTTDKLRETLESNP